MSRCSVAPGRLAAVASLLFGARWAYEVTHAWVREPQTRSVRFDCSRHNWKGVVPEVLPRNDHVRSVLSPLATQPAEDATNLINTHAAKSLSARHQKMHGCGSVAKWLCTRYKNAPISSASRVVNGVRFSCPDTPKILIDGVNWPPPYDHVRSADSHNMGTGPDSDTRARCIPPCHPHCNENDP